MRHRAFYKFYTPGNSRETIWSCSLGPIKPINQTARNAGMFPVSARGVAGYKRFSSHLDRERKGVISLGFETI
ncbi:MAG: hypothetical protein DRH17_09955 [Deltaproteobacteria bacterium]|nr:MAG: hypothetical protein DRH17_09955 [Deltaproteobacteria bacterium]